jgi:RNase H-fold protein (predicted Holliday junction resolvase)
VGSIGAVEGPRPEVGVATESGRSYYEITSLLRQSRVPYVDVLTDDFTFPETGSTSPRKSTRNYNSLKLIITTRKESLRFESDRVMCIEDLGKDIGLAKEKLIPILSPKKESDTLVIGIDPGKRIGLAAFMNQLEIESKVLGSVDEVVRRVSELFDNAPDVEKTVKVGFGIPLLANEIASRLRKKYDPRVARIMLVDERGTSSLSYRKKPYPETRDQRAAKLIAFRDGSDFAGI